MRVRTYALGVAVLLMMASAPLHGQGNSKQQNRLVQQNLKLAEKTEQERARRDKLRAKIQPQIDEIGIALSRWEDPDRFVGAYLNSLGQSMVPAEVDASVSFSFRVLYEIRPNAMALPDGRIYVTTGLLSIVENEAQLAFVLGHEIGHVIQEHSLGHWRRIETVERRNKIIGAAAGVGLGGLFGVKRGGGAGAVAGAVVGAQLGFGVASVANAVMRIKFGREQEKEADLVGAELAMARGFDPDEGRAFFQDLHDRFGKRRFSLDRALSSMFATHPSSQIRATNIHSVLSGDLASQYQSMLDSGGLATGSGRLGRVLSAVIRDNGILLAEESDRFDLALENLERAYRYRPNDARLLWGLGRVHQLLARTDEQVQRAEDFLARAVESDHRKFYPAIHRDLAYLRAARREDYTAAAEGLKQYVLGHVEVHGVLPSDLDEVYDHLVLFGDTSWTAPSVGRQQQGEGSSDSIAYTAQLWTSPGSGLRKERTAEINDAISEALALAGTTTGVAATLEE